MFLVPVVILVFLTSMAIFAPIISNQKPLAAKSNGQWVFPILSENKYLIQDPQLDYLPEPLHEIYTAPVHYSPGKSDMLNANFCSPFHKQFYKNDTGEIVELPVLARHFLGTNKRGEDVLAGIIHGARISLLVGLLSMLIAALIGIFLGAISGFYGDKGLKISRGSALMLIPGIFIAFFYASRSAELFFSFISQSTIVGNTFLFLLQIFIFFLILWLFAQTGKVLNLIPFFRKNIGLPLDLIIGKLTELMVSFPRMVLIITIAAIVRPSVATLIAIIGLTSWTTISRIIRAEVLKIKETGFIEACRSLGFKNFRILFRHALPNVFMPALIAIIFGIPSVILIESGLSFLGIGVPPDIVTWGSLISDGSENFSAWWLIVFPGLALFATILGFNLLADRLQEKAGKQKG